MFLLQNDILLHTRTSEGTLESWPPEGMQGIDVEAQQVQDIPKYNSGGKGIGMEDGPFTLHV